MSTTFAAAGQCLAVTDTTTWKTVKGVITAAWRDDLGTAITAVMENGTEISDSVHLTHRGLFLVGSGRHVSVWD